MTTNKLLLRFISGLFILTSIVACGITVNEARKEIIALCGNFHAGVLKKDVIRQLNTGTFLEFEELNTNNRPQIHVSSKFTLNLVTCDIEFDKNHAVISVIRD